MRSGYLVSLSYEDEFISLMERLESIYPPELFEIQGIANKNIDINEFSKNFFRKSCNANVASVSIDPNSNVSEMHIAQWTYEFPKGMSRLNSLFLLWDSVRKCSSIDIARETVEAVVSGDIFINDSHQFERPYCFGFDLHLLCSEGLKFFSPLNIKAPKRADSFIDLLIQATAFLSNQIAGATSFPTLFVHLDWYLRKDYGETYAERLKEDTRLQYTVRNFFQKLIYSWGFPFRGSQSPFVNVSIFDRGFLEKLFGQNETGGYQYLNPDGTPVNIDSVYILQKDFYEYFNSIFGVENIFTFPVVTLACSLDENREWVDPEFKTWITEVYGEKCLGNIYIGRPTSFSSCCRMKNDYELLGRLNKSYHNSFGVGGISIGSTRVSGLNLPRIAFRMKKDNTDDFRPYLSKYLELCHQALYAHRQLMKRMIENKAFPLYTANWISLDKQYCTLGFIGAYEFLDILGKNILSDEGSSYLLEVLSYMEDTTVRWSSEDEIPYNIEQIPGESMAIRLAKIDKLLNYNTDYETDCYSNQYIPLSKPVSLYDRLRIQGMFDSYTSGGAICHLNIGDSVKLSQKQMDLLMESARLTGTTYFAVNRIFVKCASGHYAISNNGKCPTCGDNIVTQYTRVVGFIVPTKSWHPSRQEEFRHRIFYSQSDRMFS